MFEPALIAKDQRRLPGFEDHVIRMDARGMSVREIRGHLLELYGLEVSPDLISTLTDEVLAEGKQGRRRRLERCLPLSLDALRLQIREEGSVKNKAVSLALGMGADDCYEVLGLWIEQTEGAKCWLKVFNELRNRGLSDLLIAVVDGLHGFPDATQPSIRRPSQTCRPFDPQFTGLCQLGEHKDLCGVHAAALRHCECRYQQAFRQKAADAMEQARYSFAFAGLEPLMEPFDQPFRAGSPKCPTVL